MSRVWKIRVIVLAALIGAGMLFFETVLRVKPGPVTLRFVATAAGDPLVFDTFAYTNPGGSEPFRLRDFRVYVSNIVLNDGQRSFAVEESYHLLRFDRSTPQAMLVLPDVPLMQISEVSMSIGIDASANGSIEPRGDLDPNNRMAWNWNIGYKFLLVEGAIQVAGVVEPLVYHVGFNESRRDLRFVAKTPLPRDSTGALDFSVDVMELFTGAEVIDMATLPTVKMDRSDAARLATNYETMITAQWPAR